MAGIEIGNCQIITGIKVMEFVFVVVVNTLNLIKQCVLNAGQNVQKEELSGIKN